MYTYIYQILIICQTMHFANIISNFLPIMSLLAIDGFNGLQISMKDIIHNPVGLLIKRSYSSVDQKGHEYEGPEQNQLEKFRREISIRKYS